ncbi:hypothetical protein HYDPIDRAFT_90572, partial [Hydnomerulius pinastri MD-312]
SLAASLVRQGVMPSAPITPHVAFTLDVLEFYRVARQRNLHYSIQTYVKTLCDLQGVHFKSYVSRQFTIALDVYLQVRVNVAALVQESIRRNTPDWRLKHACPACTYILKEEPNLRFKLLYAQDGNDSLKRVMKKALDEDLEDEGVVPSSLARPSDSASEVLVGDRYLSREYVDGFAASSRDLLNGEVSMSSLSGTVDDGNPCAGRWKNMKEDETKRMWGVFDESGIFMAVCRHGFSLVIADMVQSGEQAKYPLAVTAKLMDAFGANLGAGYDIGCRFKTTLSRSSLGPLAQSLHHTSLVNAFHGHAHNRLCQLDNLTTYVEGLGLEDLEGCERTFSKSNGLASAVRYATSFHRRQAIACYFEHNDDYEIFANLSTFLLNNYKQASNILYNGKTSLPLLKRQLGVEDNNVFEHWLSEEREYLKSLLSEPEEETLQMQYWQKLINLSGSEKDLRELDANSGGWSVTTPDQPASAFGANDANKTAKIETLRRHARENYTNALGAVQELELKLNIGTRWQPGDDAWNSAARLVANRKYQRALDTLERLVVSRIFELTRMNQSGTGYKMRKHISKALQVHSAAIRTALDNYNTAAKALSPPRRTLSFDEVVEYAFLSDFDLLRDARQDVSQQPWASPTARLAMDTYFKMKRAEEEIIRLNIEIRRLVTYLHDEDNYLGLCEAQLRPAHPALAYQVTRHRNIRQRFYSHHYEVLAKIAKLRDFTGTLALGVSVENDLGESASTPRACIPALLKSQLSAELWPGVDMDNEEEDVDEDYEDDIETHAENVQRIMSISTDT